MQRCTAAHNVTSSTFVILGSTVNTKHGIHLLLKLNHIFTQGDPLWSARLLTKQADDALHNVHKRSVAFH